MEAMGLPLFAPELMTFFPRQFPVIGRASVFCFSVRELDLPDLWLMFICGCNVFCNVFIYIYIFVCVL